MAIKFYFMKKTVLISGATGMIGRKLSKQLKVQNYIVKELSREKSDQYFYWNPDRGEIDERALENVDAIIHLAGAPISKRWSIPYKVKLYDSRIESMKLLLKTAEKLNQPIKTFICASGTNYYGTITTNEIFTEDHSMGEDYLAKLCGKIEEVANEFHEIGSRVCIVRTSAVLSNDGGMLKELLPLAKTNILSSLGTGKQIIPWIHIDDIVNIYIHLLENENLNGAFNAVADEHITNKKFTKTLMKLNGKKIIMPRVPAFVLRIVLGEMSSILLKGSAISNEKIKSTGFEFKFKKLKPSLRNLIRKANEKKGETKD